MLNKSLRGFTLIELIIVIIILGILAVTAAPKFVSFERDAKINSLKAVAGSFKDGLRLVHAKAIIKGVDQGHANLTLNNVTIPLWNGRPDTNNNVTTQALAQHLSGWLDIDVATRAEIAAGSSTASFFIEKMPNENLIQLFLAQDINQYSPDFYCYIIYENTQSVQDSPYVGADTQMC